MAQIDEFQSIFKRAEREAFVFRPADVSRVTLVTDRDHDAAARTRARVETFLPRLKEGCEWATVVVSEHRGAATLAEAVEKTEPDLVVAFRHLGEAELVPQHSLGVYLDVLTQISRTPVLVLPGTATDPRALDGLCDVSMVVTDHFRGDERLATWAASLAPEKTSLWLAHVEDDYVFERYMRVIGQIQELDTDLARDRIERVLLEEADESIESVKAGLTAAGVGLTIESHVSRGHRLEQFRALVEDHKVELLVMNTKDDGQLAMHGMAYALAVEMVEPALLML